VPGLQTSSLPVCEPAVAGHEELVREKQQNNDYSLRLLLIKDNRPNYEVELDSAIMYVYVAYSLHKTVTQSFDNMAL